MPRKSRKKSKSRKKKGASVLGDVWEYGFVNPVSNLVVKPTEYAVGAVIPGQVGRELQSRGMTHRQPGMYGKKGSFFGGKRRKSRKKKRRRGGGEGERKWQTRWYLTPEKKDFVFVRPVRHHSEIKPNRPVKQYTPQELQDIFKKGFISAKTGKHMKIDKAFGCPAFTGSDHCRRARSAALKGSPTVSDKFFGGPLESDLGKNWFSLLTIRIEQNFEELRAQYANEKGLMAVKSKSTQELLNRLKNFITFIDEHIPDLWDSLPWFKKEDIELGKSSNYRDKRGLPVYRSELTKEQLYEELDELWEKQGSNYCKKTNFRRTGDCGLVRFAGSTYNNEFTRPLGSGIHWLLSHREPDYLLHSNAPLSEKFLNSGEFFVEGIKDLKQSDFPMPAIYKDLSPDTKTGGGSKKLNDECTRQYIGSECAPGLICQDGRCKDKKDSKFFYRTGKVYDTYMKRPKGLSRQGLSLGFSSFGGKSRRKSRKKRRRSRKRRR